MKIEIVDFTSEHLEAAALMAIENYKEERRAVPELPEFDAVPELAYFAENGMGVAAYADGRFAGFLSGCEPYDNAFGTNARGVFSPMHAHAAITENRERIWQRMYQAAGAKWVSKGAHYHCVSLYAHDSASQRALFTYNFGMRCMDAVRYMTPIETATSGLTFRTLTKAQETEIRDMRHALHSHLTQSPCFMYESEQNFEEWLARAESRKTQVFAAYDGPLAIAFYEITDDAENFATEADDMLNINGAYCRPEYRGKGAAVALLNFVIENLRKRGIKRIGVDFESMNPTANAFWNRHFSAYTHSLTRRVDEHI